MRRYPEEQRPDRSSGKRKGSRGEGGETAEGGRLGTSHEAARRLGLDVVHYGLGDVVSPTRSGMTQRVRFDELGTQSKGPDDGSCTRIALNVRRHLGSA